MMAQRSPAAALAALVLALGMLVAAAGCGADISEETYGQIETGMTLQQVERIIGASGTREEASGGYGIGAGGVMHGSRGDDRVRTYTWSSGGREIVVRFRDDEVVEKFKRGF